jgi:hypothetical protein
MAKQEKSDEAFWEAMASYKNIVRLLVKKGDSFTFAVFTKVFGVTDIEAKSMLEVMVSLCFIKYQHSQFKYVIVNSDSERLDLCMARIQSLKQLNNEIVKETVMLRQMMELDLGWVPDNKA